MARLLLPVPLGVRPADLPRKPARHRSVPGSLGAKLYHMGFRLGALQLADANESRERFRPVLIRIARPLYARDPIGVDLDQSLYALDSTTIDLCLSLFPWAKFRRHKAAVKMHTLRTCGATGSVNILGVPPPSTSGSGLRRFRPLRVMRTNHSGYSHPASPRCARGHTDRRESAKAYPDSLRRVSYFDAATASG